MKFATDTVVLGILVALLFPGCGEKVAPESPVPAAPKSPAGTGKGTLLVTGTGKQSYLLHDGKGVYLASVKTNRETELAAGAYTVHLGNRVEATVKGGERTTIATGTLLVTGTGKGSWQLIDGKGTFQTSVKTNEEKELVAGTYTVHLGNRVEATVKGGERTTIAAGTLLVTGTGKEDWQLHDGKGVFQTSLKPNVEVELAPGAYNVRLDGKDHPVVIVGGKRTDLER